MTQEKKRFGLGTSFKDLCELNELSLSHLDTLINSLSDVSLDTTIHQTLDELSASIDGFINHYHTPITYASLEELLQSAIQSSSHAFQASDPNPNHLFSGLGDLLED